MKVSVSLTLLGWYCFIAAFASFIRDFLSCLDNFLKACKAADKETDSVSVLFLEIVVGIRSFEFTWNGRLKEALAVIEIPEKISIKKMKRKWVCGSLKRSE